MQKWEYGVESFGVSQYAEAINAELDDYGRDGWEAIGMLPGNTPSEFRVMFKRPLPAEV